MTALCFLPPPCQPCLALDIGLARCNRNSAAIPVCFPEIKTALAIHWRKKENLVSTLASNKLKHWYLALVNF
ncbi:hypothetical protein C8F04DRAFT_1142991 [Mycena alexandri]|uniref:Uncharacterized protein n=1 Tax=Mycena alexandri TaxID=1745969 RepID=A0AAD6S7W6_9AGAR|nr:hypothetical protein C8F04DRAFT_1142991 [Mycena alexandri]